MSPKSMTLDDLARRRARIAHEHVVVVGVAVDHAAAQAGQGGHDLGLEEGEEALDQARAASGRAMWWQ